MYHIDLDIYIAHFELTLKDSEQTLTITCAQKLSYKIRALVFGMTLSQTLLIICENLHTCTMAFHFPIIDVPV